MPQYRYTQVDVFTEQPLLGNPLAVVHAADGLSDAQMQLFARWTNLSETAFLLTPADPRADYRVRIFTPNGELPFAGHPTLGSCHAWLTSGGQPQSGEEAMQECGVGLVRVRLSGQRAAFAAPPLRMTPVEESVLQPVLAALGLSSQVVQGAMWLDNGPTWLGLLLDDERTVLGIEPDHAALKSLCKVGVVSPRRGEGDTSFEVRGFAAAIGINEDPVTGSLNASLAQWLIGADLAPAHYVAAQGTALGRVGRVYIDKIGDTVWVGGSSVNCIEGQLTL